MMRPIDRAKTNERMRAMVPVAIIHAALGYALVSGLDLRVVQTEVDRLKLFRVAPERPPPSPIAERSEPENDRPDGVAAPPSRPPTPVVAPPPSIRLDVPSPIIAAPVAGAGVDRSPGTSQQAGVGTGSGGEGVGTGSGGAGDGTGGGLGRSAEQIAGSLMNSDYPRAAKRAGEEGAVSVRYLVGTDGRVRNCRVIFSSAGPLLNETTCAVIEQRFRFRPALNRTGQPIEWVVRRDFDWFFVRSR